MFRAKYIFTRLNKSRKQFYTNKPTNNNINTNSNNSNGKKESSVSKYEEAYRQLDNLDFMKAIKILSDPPKKKKFGLDFHLVQLFFACLPSLAVCLVAQYARHEMRRMDAELEEKQKKEEEEKAKELEQKAIEEKQARGSELLEVKGRLDKLEETVKEIVVASNKQSGSIATKTNEDKNKKKPVSPSEPGNENDKSGPIKSDKSEPRSTQKMEQTPEAPRQDQKGNIQQKDTSTTGKR